MSTSSEEYQDNMDVPMEHLATALWGMDGPEGMKDHEIVEIAARKIIMLRKMILATGFSENMLKAVMDQ